MSYPPSGIQNFAQAPAHNYVFAGPQGHGNDNELRHHDWNTLAGGRDVMNPKHTEPAISKPALPAPVSAEPPKKPSGGGGKPTLRRIK